MGGTFRVIDKKLCSRLNNSVSIITKYFHSKKGIGRNKTPFIKITRFNPKHVKRRMQFANQKCHQFVEVSWCEVLWKNEKKKSCDRLRKITSWKLCRWLWFSFCCWCSIFTMYEKGKNIFLTNTVHSLLRNSSLIYETMMTKIWQQYLFKVWKFKYLTSCSKF